MWGIRRRAVVSEEMPAPGHLHVEDSWEGPPSDESSSWIVEAEPWDLATVHALFFLLLESLKPRRGMEARWKDLLSYRPVQETRREKHRDVCIL